MNQTTIKKIPIVFCFDNQYVIPAAVAFYSLLDTAKKGIFYEMFVLHNDISAENQNLLQNIIQQKNNACLHFIDTQNFLIDEWQKGSYEGHQLKKQFTANVLVKCFIAQFLPQFDQVIYSDVDIVVMQDISNLYDLDLNSGGGGIPCRREKSVYAL